MHDWKSWDDPSVADRLECWMLTRFRQWGDEWSSQRYMRIGEEYEPGKLVLCGEIIVLNFANASAKVFTDRDEEFFDFVTARDDFHGWGFNSEPLVDPKVLEQLFDMLKSVSTPTVNYRLYTDGQLASIVRELIIEPVADIPAWNRCHITGQPHNFDPRKFPIFESRASTTRLFVVQYCHDCHLPVITEGL